MNFNCAELLGYSHNYNLWGEGLHPNSTQSLTIRGTLNGDLSAESISGIWNQMNLMISGCSGDSIPIIVNSVNIGTGRVLSLDFDKGPDTRHKGYTATIEIPRHAGSGIYTNSGVMPLNSTYFSGNPSSVYDFFSSSTGKYIANFSDSFSVDVLASGKFNLQRDLSFFINSGIYSEFGVSASNYASRVINSYKTSYSDFSVLSIFYPTFYKNLSGITYTNQSFNNITNEASFSETFKFQSGLNYIWNYNHSIDYDNNGFNISENGTIESSQLLSSKISAAESAWSGISTGIFTRVSGLYSEYTGYLGYTGSCSLKNFPIGESTVKDNCAGTIQYSRSYSNDIFNTSSGYSYSYEDTISQDEDGFISVSEKGTFKSLYNKYPTGFYTSYSGYSNRTGEILNRLSTLYLSYTGVFYNCGFSSGLHLESESLVMQEHEGIVSYDKSYSDNIRTSGNDIYSRISHTISITEPVHIVNYFPISYDNILAQRARQSTRGNFVNTINLVSRENRSLQDFVATATGLIRFPDGDDVILKDYSYEYSPLSKNFSMTAGYSYGNYISPSDILL